LKAARLGMWISIDNLRENAQLLRSNVERLKSLKAAGLLDRVLVSQDAGWYRPLEKNGGNFFPYRFVEMNLIPELRRNGFSESDIDQLMIANPRKAFALHSRD
jgi:phosphotriesterase-related protein